MGFSSCSRSQCILDALHGGLVADPGAAATVRTDALKKKTIGTVKGNLVFELRINTIFFTFICISLLNSHYLRPRRNTASVFSRMAGGGAAIVGFHALERLKTSRDIDLKWLY